MSAFIIHMSVPGFSEMPPLSKVMPLPTKAKRGVFLADFFLRCIGDGQQSGLMDRTFANRYQTWETSCR